ncbi:MAG: bifunctional metallophosphatase/5'-nucleotidase, partial [Turicibacter sp.]
MKNLKIYFTSDLHGYVYPTDYRDSTQKQMGMLNIINAFKKDGNTLVIDGGDTIQGSPFTTYL